MIKTFCDACAQEITGSDLVSSAANIQVDKLDVQFRIGRMHGSAADLHKRCLIPIIERAALQMRAREGE